MLFLVAINETVFHEGFNAYGFTRIKTVTPKMHSEGQRGSF